MKLLKSRRVIICLIVLSGVCINTVISQKPHQKFKKIQKYIDEATEGALTGVVIYVKSPKYGKWIGTSGYSDIENNIHLKEDAIFSLASIGKTYNAVAALKLIEEGKIGLNDPISKYLSSEIIEGIPNAKQVTVKHLLGHTSGFHNYNRHPELNKLYLSGNLKLDTLSHINALRRYAYGVYPHTKPVGTYQYSSTNYLLLTMVIDKVLPEGHAAYLRQHVLNENGFTNSYYKQTPPTNLVNHYGDINKDNTIENLSAETIETTNWYSGDDGVYAPIEEAADFLQKLMHGEILNKDTLKTMMTWNDDKNPNYGLGLMADKGFPYKFLVGHSGRGIGITTDLYYFPKQEMTIAVFCNTGLRSGTKDVSNTYYKMRNKIMKKLFLF